jgi:hypothetical protein
MYQENDFDSLIEEMTYPVCPKCGSTQVAVNESNSACLSNCDWIGPTSQSINNNLLVKCLITQEAYLNLASVSEKSLKVVSKKIAFEKDFPGSLETSQIKDTGQVCRIFLSKTDEFGEELNITDYLSDKTIKLFKLGAFTHFGRLCSSTADFASTLGVDLQKEKKFASSRIPHPNMFDSSEDILLAVGGSVFDKTGTPNQDLFRQKMTFEVNTSFLGEELEVKVYSCVFGRPDIILNSTYTKIGASIPDKYSSITISDISMMWQPFYWPSLFIDPSQQIRLVGVLQYGSDNINYVVTESMDDGTFKAGVYKRETYSHEVKYIESKATSAEEAVRRLRTSFEKSLDSIHGSGSVPDLFWIKDWNYDSSIDISFKDVLTAPFWEHSMNCELLHLIGESKEQLLKEMYEEIQPYIENKQ